MAEALEALREQDIHVNTLRVRAFPFDDDVSDFIADHSQVFVIEQNRDGQMRMLLVNECGVDPTKLISVLHYDGTPITARFITREIAEKVGVLKPIPLKKKVAR